MLNTPLKEKPSRIKKSNEAWLTKKGPTKPKRDHPWRADKIFNTQIQRDPDAIN
jgi:hypothetical protein